MKKHLTLPLNVSLSVLFLAAVEIAAFGQSSSSKPSPDQCTKSIEGALLGTPKAGLHLPIEASASSFEAKAANVHDLHSSTHLAATYLDYADAGGSTTPRERNVVLSKLRTLDALGLDLPDWQRQQRLKSYSDIEGVYQDSDGTVIYLKGANTLHAVKVHRSGQIEELGAQQAVDEYRTYLTNQIRIHSTQEMTLFGLEHLRDGSHQVVIGSKTIALTPAEFGTLSGGGKLPPDHPLSVALASDDFRPKVLFSDPFMQKPGALTAEADKFAFGLQRAYPEIPILRDPYSPRTQMLVKQLNSFMVAGPNQITAIVAEDTFRFRPKDFRVVMDLEEQLRKAHISVVRYHDGTQITPIGSNRGLIVITGHSDQQLAGFVHALGASGAFRDNYVLFNSCETELTRQLVTEINTRYGAIATMAHQGTVRVDSVDSFISDFAERVSATERVIFRDMVLKSLHNSGLNGIWTICESTPQNGINGVTNG